MPRKVAVIERLDALTDRLSTQVRTIALGILALAWALLSGRSDAAESVSGMWKSHLVFVAWLSILVMFLDFLQYVAGYRDTRNLLDRMEREGKDEAQYNEKSFWRKARESFFISKQLVLGLAVLWLLVIVGRWLTA